MHWDWILKLDWNIICSAVTAISTFLMMVATCFMAVAAWRALNTWKNEQKREKLVTLLESLNEYIYDLQYYEHEGTIFSKLARTNKKEDYRNQELIQQQKNIIDTELAEESGRVSLYIDNWLIQEESQAEDLKILKQKLANYKNKIFDFIKLKIDIYCEKNKPENILYGQEKGLIEKMYKQKSAFEEMRKDLATLINKFKKINNKLLN